MISGHNGNPLKVMDAATKSGYGSLRGEEEPGGHISHGQDGSGTNGRDLTFQERAARFGLILLGIAISRWTTLDDITDVKLVPSPTRSRDDRIQESSGGTHKGSPLHVLILTRALAHDDYPC